MSSYSKSTDFAAKDSLPSGNANKVVSGTEINTEFNAIETAVNSKANTASPTFTGIVSAGTVNIDGGNIDGTVIGSASAAAGTFTTITGTVITGTSLVIGAADVTEAELEILDGATVTTAELNVLDGITATTAELNYTDGVTSAIQTQLNTKAPLASPTFTGTATLPTVDINAGNIDGTVIGAAAAAAGSFTTVTASGAITGASLVIGAADVSEAELEILDGATVTTAELNVLDGITATTAELNILDGVTATAAEINVLDGVTATTAELNYTDGVTSAIQTQLNTKAPTASPTFTGTVTAAALTTTGAFTSPGIDDNATSTHLTVDNNGISVSGFSYLTGTGAGDLYLAHTSNAAVGRLRSIDGTLRLEADYLGGVASSGIEGWVDGSAKWATDSSGNFVVGSTSAGAASAVTLYADGTFKSNGIDDNATSNAVTIDSSGNVGIGTSSPSTKLNTSSGVLRTNTAKTYISFQSSTDFDDFRFGLATAIKGGATGADRYVSLDSAIYTVSTGSFGIGSSLVLQELGGNVGIGTSSPTRPLEVTDSTSDGSGGVKISSYLPTLELDDISGGGTSFILQQDGDDTLFKHDSTERMRIDSSGNVGIGTSSPTVPLHVDAAGMGDIYSGLIENTTTDTDHYNVLRFMQGAAGSATGYIGTGGSTVSNISFRNAFVVGTQTANPLVFNVNDTERMRIDSSGNVGIGVNSPSGYRLNVSKGATGNIAQLTDGVANTFIIRSDSNTLYAGNANNYPVAFVTNNTERMRIDASGNVGIGVSPTEELHVYKNANTDVTILAENPSTGVSARTGFRGISDSAQIDMYAVGSFYTGVPSWADAGVISTSTNTSGGLILNAQAGGIKLQIGTVEKARLDTSGNLLVGKTASAFGTAGHEFKPSGETYHTRDSATPMFLRRNTTDGVVLDIWKDSASVGSISVTGSATSYNTSSDARLKENIADADDAGSKIDAIQVRKYDWKADGSHQDYGMVAQELMTVAPEAVSGDPESDDMMGVDYSKLVPMLVKEIQSLRARVAQLEGAN